MPLLTVTKTNILTGEIEGYQLSFTKSQYKDEEAIRRLFVSYIIEQEANITVIQSKNLLVKRGFGAVKGIIADEGRPSEERFMIKGKKTDLLIKSRKTIYRYTVTR